MAGLGGVDGARGDGSGDVGGGGSTHQELSTKNHDGSGGGCKDDGAGGGHSGGRGDGGLGGGRGGEGGGDFGNGGGGGSGDRAKAK